MINSFECLVFRRQFFILKCHHVVMKRSHLLVRKNARALQPFQQLFHSNAYKDQTKRSFSFTRKNSTEERRAEEGASQISNADLEVLQKMDATFANAIKFLENDVGEKAVMCLKIGYNDCVDFLASANKSVNGGIEEEALITELFKEKARRVRNKSTGRMLATACGFSVAAALACLALVNFEHFFDNFVWAIREAFTFVSIIVMVYFGVRFQRSFRVFRYFRALLLGRKNDITTATGVGGSEEKVSKH